MRLYQRLPRASRVLHNRYNHLIGHEHLEHNSFTTSNNNHMYNVRTPLDKATQSQCEDTTRQTTKIHLGVGHVRRPPHVRRCAAQKVAAWSGCPATDTLHLPAAPHRPAKSGAEHQGCSVISASSRMPSIVLNMAAPHAQMQNALTCSLCAALVSRQHITSVQWLNQHVLQAPTICMSSEHMAT